MKKSRRYFDQQFKIDAVRLATESGKPVAEVARELGINHNMLDRWKRALLKKGSAAAFPGNGNLSTDKREIEELRRELARVKEEREILEFILKVIFKREPPDHALQLCDPLILTLRCFLCRARKCMVRILAILPGPSVDHIRMDLKLSG